MTMEYGAVRGSLDEVLVSFSLPSGAAFSATRGHGLLMLSAAMLFIEVVKSTSTSTSSIVETCLAFVCFTGVFILFLLNAAFGTIEFALITTMMLIDFMAGFIVMTISSRRDVAWA